MVVLAAGEASALAGRLGIERRVVVGDVDVLLSRPLEQLAVLTVEDVAVIMVGGEEATKVVAVAVIMAEEEQEVKAAGVDMVGTWDSQRRCRRLDPTHRRHSSFTRFSTARRTISSSNGSQALNGCGFSAGNRWPRCRRMR